MDILLTDDVGTLSTGCVISVRKLGRQMGKLTCVWSLCCLNYFDVRLLADA